MNRFLFPLFLIAFLICGSFHASSARAQEPAYAAVLVKDLIDLEQSQEFDCLNRVYVMLTWFNLPGKHRATAIWLNPQDKQQDIHDLDFEGGEEVTCWLALEFLHVQNERNPMLVNTAAAKFHGTWKVKLLLDGNLLETQTFNVTCS